MARRKRKSTRRRSRRRGMSEGKSFMSSPGRRSRRRKGGRKRRRGFLSESFSQSNIKESGRAVFSGLIGGGIANVINKFEMPGWGRAVLNLGASFVTGTVLNAPNMGAGIAGAYGLLLAQQLEQGTLKEGYDYADENVLAEHPQFADANGNPMYLADGNLYYLEEGVVDPAEELMSQQTYLADDIYPNYVNPSQY